MAYTYYGDLLGISGFYRLDPARAYERLNEFYNTTFSCLSDYCKDNSDVKVIMFSDSLLIWGNDTKRILKELQKVYEKLLDSGLLLRGAIVKGSLRNFDPRRTLDNFDKMLPINDALARAVGLASTQKGARFLIEIQLAQELLVAQPEWFLPGGYERNPMSGEESTVKHNSILRRICPTPDTSAYEFLYLWDILDDQKKVEQSFQRREMELKTTAGMLRSDIAEHYEETLNLLDRCQLRRKVTYNIPIDTC